MKTLKVYTQEEFDSAWPSLGIRVNGGSGGSFDVRVQRARKILTANAGSFTVLGLSEDETYVLDEGDWFIDVPATRISSQSAGCVLEALQKAQSYIEATEAKYRASSRLETRINHSEELFADAVAMSEYLRMKKSPTEG